MVRGKHHIGGYRIIAPIGAGGFATVYRALDESTNREVAIKVLAENHSLVAETRRRFVDEVGLLATIDSPSIAKIYRVGETEDGQPFMVLELADRGDLRHRLDELRRKQRVLDRGDLLVLSDHLWQSLTTLHRAEIIHRDVSPGNILIRSAKNRPGPGGYGPSPTAVERTSLLEPGERFLLADLGHAKDMIRASGFTAGGGTKGYAAPEQLDDVTVVDLRADIFSATAVMEWAVHDGPFAADLESFFEIGLAEDPDDRFTSMSEWHTAFTEALGAADGEQVAIRRRLLRVMLTTIAVAVVGLTTFALLAQYDSRGVDDNPPTGPSVTESGPVGETTVTSGSGPVATDEDGSTLRVSTTSEE